MLDEVDGDALGRKDAAQGFIALQLGGRADAGHHGGGHVTEQQRHIFLLGGQMLCDLHRGNRFTAAGASPHGENATAGLHNRFQFLRLRVSTKQASFDEVHSPAASLSAAGSAPSLSSVSALSAFSAPSAASASGSAYSSSIRASCAAINSSAFSGAPR